MELKELSFQDQTFQKVSGFGADLAKKEFSGCIFKGCDLGGQKLSGSIFIGCTFIECNLSNTKVDTCSFRDVSFDECKLVGVSFGAVNPFLLDWTFKKCKIDMCDFSAVKMKHSRFIECVIHGTDFINADLTEADFSGSDLNGSKFHRTILEKSNFTGASRYYIDPTNNRLKQARFSIPEVLSLLAPFEIRLED